MSRKEMTMGRFEEIKRLLGLGLSENKISKVLRCSRNTVKGVRVGDVRAPDSPKAYLGPPWVDQINWEEVIKDLRGHPLKYIWEEQASSLIGYPGFWKQFYRKYPEYKQGFVTHREFAPGDRCEVDYAGGTIPWVSMNTGEVREAPVFISALGHSQKIFAESKDDMKSKNFLECHNHMYEDFEGVPHVTAPDNLKQGVKKYHLYDPDLNIPYMELAKHYGTAIVPARLNRPKDKAIVEGAVKLVMRYFKFRYRKHTFTSVGEINQALKEVVNKINQKVHTRFKISRQEMWERYERDKLKPLPSIPYEFYEWKETRVHPDTYINIESNYYSAPHIHRGKIVKAKIGRNQIEIFLGLERIALHAREKNKQGRYITDLSHLPDNARAYLETTPQNVLSQAKYINQDLYKLIDELFNENALGHLRRALGFIRIARKEIEELGQETAKDNINSAVNTMKLFSKIRVPYFKELLNKLRKEKTQSEEREIIRQKDNPLLRYKTSKEENPPDGIILINTGGN